MTRSQQRYAAKKQAGICVHPKCQETPKPGRVRCEAHGEYLKRATLKYYKKRFAAATKEQRMDLEKLSRTEADAASLRRAFNDAVRTDRFPQDWLPEETPRELKRKIIAAFSAWWNQFYHAVTNHEAGLELLKQLALQEELLNQYSKVIIGGKRLPAPELHQDAAYAAFLLGKMEEELSSLRQLSPAGSVE